MAEGPREWAADAYHRLGEPQLAWGTAVLRRLPLTGDETVLDAGCGSGRLTGLLLDRLPRGRVIAVDASRDMLRRAHGEFGGDPRVALVHADLTELHPAEPVDAVFSNAVFHHVPDHERLFRRLHMALRPGGLLVAQWGGGPNLARIRGHVACAASADDRLAPLRGWPGAWRFAEPVSTVRLLRSAGFAVDRVSLTPAPVSLSDEQAFSAHLTAITLRSHLARLADDTARRALVDAVTSRAAADDPPFTLDHWRLDADARRP